MSHQLWFLVLKTQHRRVLLLGLITVLAGLSGVALALLLANTLTALLNGPVSLIAALAVLALMLSRYFLAAGAERLAANTAAAAKATFRHRLLMHLMAVGPVQLAGQREGRLATILQEGIESFDGYISRFMPAVTAALILPPLVLLLMLWLVGPAHAGVLLAAALVMPLMFALSGLLAARASRRQLQSLQRLSGLFRDRLQRLKLLRLAGRIVAESDNLKASSDDFRRRTMRVLRLAFLSSFGLELAVIGAFIGQIWLLVSAGAPVALGLVVILLLPEFFSPLRQLMLTYHDRATAIAAYQDWRELMALPVMPTGSGHEPPPLTGPPSLVFENVTFSHNAQPLLSNFSMRVEAGEWVALTGPSGRGKSTLLNLVLGFMAPEAGRILLAGSPVLDSLDKIALVSQRTNLWHGSLADNLRIARPHATEQEVVAALQAAALNLPPTTMVGDLSHGLSGGQARRVALARAYLANRPLLLLDEPTAGLDSETAAQLLASLRQLASQRTVLMVSHDPQALAAADRVVNL